MKIKLINKNSLPAGQINWMEILAIELNYYSVILKVQNFGKINQYGACNKLDIYEKFILHDIYLIYVIQCFLFYMRD